MSSWTAIYICEICQTWHAEGYSGLAENIPGRGRCDCGGTTKYKTWAPGDYLAVGDGEYLDPHANHGRGCEESGPDEPDCPCRLSPKVHECARSGCGFCMCALPEPKGYLWVGEGEYL